MRVAAAIIVVVALVLAGGVGYLLYDWLEEREQRHQQALERAKVEMVRIIPVQIVVAARALPPGHIIESKDVEWRPWPEDDVDEDFIVQEDGEGEERIDEFVDKVVRRGVARYEPMTMAKVFEREQAQFMSGLLRPGMRAVTIKVSQVTGTAGFIMPGDRVDVILTQNIGGGQGPGQMSRASETILKNVRVVAIDQTVGVLEETTKVAKTVTVEVSPKQAEVIAVARAMGSLSLVLRSLTPGPADAYEGPFTSDLEVSVALSGGTATIERFAEPVEMAAPEPEPGVPQVLTATRELPAGTLLRDRDIRWSAAPPDAPEEGLFYRGVEGAVDPLRLRGALVTGDIAAGEPIASERIMWPTEPGFLAAALGADMRAVDVDISRSPGLTALVAPGDRVDVVLTQAPETGEQPAARAAPETILQNIRVLALDGDSQTATIEVTAKQAATIAMATSMGRVSLAVRGRGAVATATDAGQMPVFTGAGRTTTRTLAAVRDLAEGSLLRDSDIRWAPLPDGLRPEDFFVSGRDTPEELRGALLRRTLAAGTPVPASAVVKPDEPGFLAAAVPPGMRAVSIGIDRVSGVDGLIAPGDRVDVLMTGAVDGRRFSEAILKKVRVLAISDATATLEVSPKQLEKIAVAQDIGRLRLGLRSETIEEGEQRERPFTSDLEVSQALSGGVDAIVALGGAAPTVEAEPEPEEAAPTAPTLPAVTTRVLVAERDLARGTLLRDSDFRFAAIEGAAPQAGQYYVKETTEVEALRGALIVEAVAAGEPLPTSAVITPDEAGFLSAAINRNMRAVSLGITATSGVGGLIAPGDRVDVVLVAGLGQRRFSETILEQVRVLSLGQGTATVEVTPKQSEEIAVAQTMGSLVLTLRSETADAQARTDQMFTSDLEVSRALRSGLGSPEEQAAPGATPVPTPTREEPEEDDEAADADAGQPAYSADVKVYRANEPFTLRFSQ